MRYSATLACVCLLTLVAAPLVRARPNQAAGEPATWITRDVQIPLQNLPEAYSCDALWYKLHGILLAIGARQYMSITPYDCGRGASGGGRSPTLDMKFQTLRALSAANARWADTSAVRRIVRLAPGEPKILHAGDCALLKQLEETLFPYLNLHVVATNLECSAPHGADAFSVSIQALTEERTPSSQVPRARH
jgi:hypothetical protein